MKLMSDDIIPELCGCGRPVRYAHTRSGDGELVWSCNKYKVCPTYEQLDSTVRELSHNYLRSRAVLERIVDTEGEAYEYKAWAKGAVG